MNRPKLIRMLFALWVAGAGAHRAAHAEPPAAAPLAPSAETDAPPASEEGGVWRIGAIGLLYRSPFLAERGDDGEGLDKILFPYVAYESPTFFIDGLEAGYHVLAGGENAPLAIGLDILTAARAVAGSSRRRITADAGLRLSLSGAFGRVSLTGLQDITNTHNGQEAKLTYAYMFSGQKLFITPSVSAIWQSRGLANHMWGVSLKQHVDMISSRRDIVLPAYQMAGSVVNFAADLTITYVINAHWSVIGYAAGAYLDKSIRLNPGIDQRYDATLGLGAAYQF